MLQWSACKSNREDEIAELCGNVVGARGVKNCFRSFSCLKAEAYMLYLVIMADATLSHTALPLLMAGVRLPLTVMSLSLFNCLLASLAFQFCISFP